MKMLLQVKQNMYLLKKFKAISAKWLTKDLTNKFLMEQNILFRNVLKVFSFFLAPAKKLH